MSQKIEILPLSSTGAIAIFSDARGGSNIVIFGDTGLHRQK
jgi:hypothetical protein